MAKILVVEDDRNLVELLTVALAREGLDVLPAFDRPTALRRLEQDQPDLALLDINLGAWDGFELLQDLRRSSQIPVIMLTARDAEDDKVRGLELGADDYLTKPFSYRELLARARAQLRRYGQNWAPAAVPNSVLEVGPLRLNVAEYTVAKDGQSIDVTATEFRLLHCLMTHAGSVVPTQTLLKEVWGYNDLGGADVVRVTVYRLRRKLGDNAARPQLLHTVPGVGVMLKPQQG